MKPTRVIVHHSATPDGETFSWPAIRRFHTSWRADGQIITESAALHLQAAGVPVTPPWSDIGYHFGIELVGKGYEVLVGRMMDEPGAHCAGRNHDSLGICFLGNYDLDTPPAEIWRMGLRLVRSICQAWGIPRDKVEPHSKHSNKTCPGLKFDMERFRRELDL